MIEEIIEKAKKGNKKVYIYAHKFPDGDAISSSCAISEYLKSYGIDSQYIATKPIKSYSQIVGNIPVSKKVDRNAISLILDTNTVSYAENELFKTSAPENIYVIDHHGKTNNSQCIEDELNLPIQNVIRDSTASSTCEILVNELNQEKISSHLANMLTLGLLTDTAKLKFLKPDTLQNLSKLIELGANYSQIIKLCTRKFNLREEVGIAKALLQAKRFPIGDTFGIILSLNNQEVKQLYNTYGVRNPQKKIFKMEDIENCSLICMLAENYPEEYNIEFRSTPIYGNFNVLQLATSHGGGGHYNASGCSIPSRHQRSLETSLEQEISKNYSAQATNLPPVKLTEFDNELLQILNDTQRLTKNVTPEILLTINKLINAGANYAYTFKKFRTFEKFMLQNEILSKVPEEAYSQTNSSLNISLSSQDIDQLKQKYHIDENAILEAIDGFMNIAIHSATLSLPNGSKAKIDKNGHITITHKDISQNKNNVDTFIEKINACTTDDEIKSVIDNIVNEINHQKTNTRSIGVTNSPIAQKTYLENGYYSDFINPNIKISNATLGYGYHIYDNEYLYEFAKGIKKLHLSDSKYLLNYIMPFLDYYFGFPKDTKDNRDNVLFEYAVKNAKEFYKSHSNIQLYQNMDPVDQMQLSGDFPISAFKGKYAAQCSERSVLAQNLLKVCGYESAVMFGESSSRNNTEGHAWNSVKLNDTFYLLDFSNTVYAYKDGKFAGHKPYFISMNPTDYSKFIKGEKIAAGKDYHYVNGKIVYEKGIRQYAVGRSINKNNEFPSAPPESR